MARFLDNKKDIDKQVKKKKKEETAAKKPQSSSASVEKVNKRLSEKYSGGSTGGKVSKPSTPSSQSRITQKSYGTTKPTITQRTTSGSTAQRQQNAERNNNLKQTMGQQARENRISRLEEERQQRQAQQEKARRTTGAVNRRLSQKYGENQVTGGRRTKLDSAADYTRDVAKGAWQGAKLAATEDAAFLNRFSNESSGNKFWNRELNKDDYDKNMRRMELRQEGWRKKIKDQQEAMQRTAEESHSRLGRLGIEAAQSAGGMAVDAMFGPFSLVHMGARVTEGAQGDVIEKAEPLKERMRQAGYSEEEINERFKGLERADFANAIMQGTIEGLTEKMFGGIGLAAKVGGKGYLDRAIGKLAGGRLGSGIAGRVARGTLEEIAEEEVGNPAQALASNVIYGNKFQGINEDIARRSLDELMAASANVDSEDFYKEARNAFKESGSSDEEANELAEMARRYLQAQLSGDSETAQSYQDQMVKRLTGGENSLKEKWTLQDAIDVGLSTAMMTVATGVPGALTTAAIGSTYKEENGLDGVRKLTEVVKNLDPDNSTKAQAILDRIDAGEDISNTQVYDVMDLSSKAAAKAKEREAVKNRLSARQMQEEDLFVQPAVITRAGYQLGEATEQRFEEISDRVLDRVGEGSEDSYTIADAVAAYETGTITAEQMNALNVENPENRTVFQEMTGIDLNQFNVTDRSGKIDEAASNTKMQTALFANAAENYVQSARIEQKNWNDKVRGMTAEAMSPGLGGEGDIAFQKAMESVDPRDRAKFMLTDAAARRVYEYARNTTDEWSDVRRDFRSMFKGVDESVLRDVFDAAKKDKTVAETQYYGQIVNRNSLTSDVAFTAGKFRNDSQRSLGNTELSTLSTIASELGVDVIMSDALDANENGRYSPKQRTITLNAANSIGDNLSFVFSHEVTHHLAAYAPDEYIKLSRFIMDTWYKNNEAEYNAEIGKIQKLYKEKKDQDLSPEQALEEIIANNAHNFWADEEFVDAVTRNEPTLAQSIINAIREFLRKLRNILASETITDERTREGLFAEIGAYDEAYRMWLDAFNAAKKARADEAIADLQERIYEEERHSLGYHAGDLGKSTVDDYAHQGYGRGTGHFGFGTYFVGNEEKINYGDYGKRKHETVDFDKYNLFKPMNFEQGLRLHDALKLIDGFATQYSEFNDIDRFSDEGRERHLDNTVRINSAAENLVDDYEWNDFQWDDSTQENKAKVDKYIADNLSDYDRSEIESKAQEEYDKVQNQSVDEEAVRKELANHYDTFKNMTDFWGNSFISDESEEAYIERNLQDTIDIRNRDKEVPYDYYYYKAAQDAIKDNTESWAWKERKIGRIVDDLMPALGYKHDREEIQSALKETERIVNSYANNGSRMDAKRGLDSAATVFMKQLGYEGVDVRDINEMDSTEYGSVIYDLKDEDLERKTEIGTARFSLSDAPSMDELDQSGDIIEDENGNDIAQFDRDGSVRFSISSFDDAGRELFTKYLKNQVKKGEFTKEEAFGKDGKGGMLGEVETVFNICKNYADKTDENGKPVYIPYNAWSYASVVTGEDGNPVFSAIKQNSEYKMNIDFSTICKKRRTLDAVFREMNSRGLLEKLDLNKDESAAMVVNINNLIRDYGFEAACALCFVEARRYRQQQTATTFRDMWNGLVESMYSDKSKIAYFNFGRDNTVEDVEDGIHTMDDSKLDLSHIKAIANAKNEDGKKLMTAEAKAARLILKDPSQRKLMRVGDMMASTGFENMQIEDPALMKIYNAKKGTGGAKSSFGDVQYLNEIIRSRTFSRMKAYAVSGVRIQSFSDYVPRMVFDYVQVIADLAAKKLPAHAYTKEKLFVYQFGLTGTKINLSLVPDVVADGTAPGLDANGNYVWNEEGTFPYDEAMAIQKAEGYKENCGTIAVGISDEQIMKMLADPTIQMVIPYHKSSLNPIVAAMTNVDRFTNYEDFQRTKDSEGKAVEKEFDWDTKLFRLTHDSKGKDLPKEKWGNVQDLVKEYVEWCNKNDYTPKFSQFLYQRKDDKIDGDIIMKDGEPVINPGYYKLLEDFALLDNDGNFKPQRDVQIKFPTESDAFGSMADLIRQGLEEDTELEANRSEKVGDIVNDIEDMIKTGAIKRQSAASEKLAERFSITPEMDADYMSAVNSGNMEEAQRLVNEAAERAGLDATTYYHGTIARDFTVFDKERAGQNYRGLSKYGKGLYFTKERDNAVKWGRKKGYKESSVKVYESYLDLKNPFNPNENISGEMLDEYNRIIDAPYYHNDVSGGMMIEMLNGVTGDSGYSTEFLKRYGYDGVADEEGDQYVVFEPEQIKSADPVTYAEDGSVIPLSERFNSENDDIRYSLSTQDSDGNIIPSDTEVKDRIIATSDDIDRVPLVDPVLEENRIRYSIAADDFIASVKTDWDKREHDFSKGIKDTPLKNKLVKLLKDARNNSGTERKYSSETLKRTIKSVERMYKSAKQGNIDDFAKEAWAAAERIVDDINYNDSLFEQYKGLRNILANTNIKVPEALAYGDYAADVAEFVRENGGRMKLREYGMEIEDIYAKLHKKFPEMFPDDIEHPIDMLMQMDYILDYIEPYKDAYTSEEYSKLVEDIANNLCQIIDQGDEYKATIDTLKVEAMKVRHEEALRKVRTQTISQKNRAEAWKQKYEQRVAKDAQTRSEKRERKEHKDKFERIRDNYNDLVKWVLKPDKNHYVPEEFRKSLAEVLQTLDLQTENSKKLEEKTGHPALKTLKLRELKEQLEALSKKDGGSGTPIFDIDSYIPALLDALIDKLDKYGNSIDSLNAHDIKEIDRLLASIKQNIKNYNNLVYETKMVPLIERGNQVIEDQEHIKKRDGVAKKYEGGIKGSMKDLNVTSLTPTYLFDRLGPGMKQMYDELRYDGFDKYIRNEAVIIDRLSDILGGYYKRGVLRKKRPKPGSELQEWRDDRSAQDITLESGETVRMTVAQIMSLYCLYNRDQARLHMIEGGGIHIVPIQVGAKIAKAKGAISGKKYATEGRNYRISTLDAENIIAKLTPEQKHIADQLQELMAKDMAKLGNEAHRMMYGYEIFDDPNYFPIKSHGTEIPTDINDINQVYEKIKSFGPAKPLDPKARNIIEIDDIFTITADHCNGMNLYNAYLVPISNFMKVYNYKTMDANVKEELTQAHGDEVMKYLSNFLSDLNGIKQSTRGGLNDIIDRALGRAKVAAVFGNIRVALQQPTAIIRALMEVDAKYFTPFLNVKLNAVPVLQANSRKEIYDEMYKYCPIALWKSWGYYDTYMGRDIEDVMMNNWSKREVALAGVYGKLDNATWSAIWQAVKAEQHDKHPDMDVKSEEFLKMCGRRASEVFDKTQVVDSTFHRSDAMRNKDRAVKALTAFMSEPTLTLNMLRGAFSEAHIAAAEGHKGKAYALRAKAIGVFLLQAAVVSAAQAFADAWRDKDPGWPGDDDDDDEKALGYWERWLHNFVADLFDQLHLENNVYLVKDVTPYINYILSKITEPIDDVHPSIPWIRALLGWDSDYLYSNNNIVMSSLEDTARGIEQVINKKEKGEEYDKEWYDIIQKTLSGPGTLFGFPIGTLMKDFKPMLQKVTELTFAADGSLMDRFGGSSDDDSSSEDSSDGYAGDYTDEQKAEIEKAAKKHQESGQTESRDAEQMLFDAEKAAAGYEGEERNKKIWQSVTKGYTGYIEAADWGYIQQMRDTIEAAGGDVDYFDQQVLEKTKSSFKKSLTYDQSDEDFVKMLSLRQYLTTHGMTEEQISSEIVYKSEIAKDMKVAFRINDENAMREALQPLADAGMTQTDLERLWDNRNRMDLVKYKNDGGRFADRLKSTGTFIWPAQGTITSEFGYRKPPTAGASANHPAIDIGAAQGSPVVASDGGTVIYAGSNGGYGNSVGIKHDNGMVTYYNHLYSWSVKVGDTVAQGQTIAQVGSTGKSTGPHLDFKVLDANGEPVNPMDYLS